MILANQSAIEVQPLNNSLNIERLAGPNATYDDLIDMFARELSSDEILLISGAAKIGGGYRGGMLYT